MYSTEYINRNVSKKLKEIEKRGLTDLFGGWYGNEGTVTSGCYISYSVPDDPWLS